MKPLYLLLGSNLGNRHGFLQRAKYLLEIKVGKISLASSLYETAPWGNTEQPHFLNQVVVIHSQQNLTTLMSICKNIETLIGREKTEHWGPRQIDIDLLFYADEIFNSDDLMIPHPAIQDRKFTLLPLVEISPAFVHPVLNQSLTQLLAGCNDSQDVKKISSQRV